MSKTRYVLMDDQILEISNDQRSAMIKCLAHAYNQGVKDGKKMAIGAIVAGITAGLSISMTLVKYKKKRLKELA